jgi:hypothetical protein
MTPPIEDARPMHAFEASADIHAPADRIWSILTDAPAYPSWDSGVTRVDGHIAHGERITVHSEVSPGRAFPVKVAMQPPTEMTWTGGLPLGLFTGVRTFRVTPDGDTTHVSMREEYGGPLAGMMWKTIPDLGPSFTRFVNGLKARAEAG